jgi:hypothetical protein
VELERTGNVLLSVGGTTYIMFGVRVPTVVQRTAELLEKPMLKGGDEAVVCWQGEDSPST